MEASAHQVTAHRSWRYLHDVGGLAFSAVFPVDEKHDRPLGDAQRCNCMAYVDVRVGCFDITVHYGVKVASPQAFSTTTQVVNPIGYRPIQKRSWMFNTPGKEICSDIKEHFRCDVVRVVRPDQHPSKTDELRLVVFPQRSNRALGVMVGVEHSRVRNRRSPVRVTAPPTFSLVLNGLVGHVAAS